MNKRNIPRELLDKLDESLKFEYEKLDLAFDSGSELRRKLVKGEFRNYTMEIQNCLVDMNCDGIKRITNTIGSLQLSKFNPIVVCIQIKTSTEV